MNHYRMFHSLTALSLASLTLGSAARAANTQPRPRLIVTPASMKPFLSANPEDSAWKNAPTIPSLPLSLGEESAGLTALPTQVKLLWDADYLYIRFVCISSEIHSPYKTHDDPIYKGDCVEMFLDVKGDARQWIELEVSPRCVTFDKVMTLTADPISDADLILAPDLRNRDLWRDLSWTLDGLRTAATIQKSGKRITGWTVDIALPAKPTLRRLGLDHFAPMTLRANFLRYEYPATNGAKRPLIAMNWSPVRWGCPHISPQAMGYLELGE
ncbi:MAG: carbohydrate-binding family 9-like protein [Capsulimonas sp.]|uniref:carbohydrate-binding family 9-like protein n=1 Tax=Capsulimonas sp. TaxID=2494211 RepID=UPI0032652507